MANPLTESYPGCCANNAHLEETADSFEKQKVKDIKTVFSEFITTEMLFQSKASEVYTGAYQNIQKIDEI